MMRVGITGGIGSGKTLVCRALQALGAAVFFADSEAKKLYHDDDKLRHQLIKAFGSAIYSSNGELQSRQLAQIVFGDAEALATLNALVHPAVAQRFERWVAQQAAVPYVVQEAALLFESNAHLRLHKTVAVCAPSELRMARVVRRDGCTEANVRQRMAHQLTDEQRLELADYRIVNDGLQALLPQVIALHEQLKIKN
ncbi:MAG: dephospho-CoA kinase [Methanobrevibacter sp.]|jgi:dephospho-CoA kinase|nr:dephospho-CoA kinase [Candidatus Methanovirga meridionalis]